MSLSTIAAARQNEMNASMAVVATSTRGAPDTLFCWDEVAKSIFTRRPEAVALRSAFASKSRTRCGSPYAAPANQASTQPPPHKHVFISLKSGKDKIRIVFGFAVRAHGSWRGLRQRKERQFSGMAPALYLSTCLIRQRSPFTLRLKNAFDGLSYSALSSTAPGDVMGSTAHFINGVRHRNRQTHALQDRQIGQVVADISNFGIPHPRRSQNLFVRPP